MNKTILITGANGGIGKDAARQLALLPHTEKIYLGCRNPEKAKAAKIELEKATGKHIFEILIIDVSNLDSVRTAVSNLKEPIDALIMNAGGMGGKNPEAKTADGVTNMYAVNVLGHSLLVDELIKNDKLKNVAMYASSEAVRGVKKMGMKQPNLKDSSADEFASIFDGSFFMGKMDPMQAYGLVKYGATMWMSSLARKHPNIRFISMSPGGTQGTEVMNDLNPFMRFMYKRVLMPIVMPMMGMAHKLEVGAKRYVDAIGNEDLKSGLFYASKEPIITGPVVDQSSIFPMLADTQAQDNAYEAAHRFI